MTRLELIMTAKKPLTPDDARALLSDHLEGALDDDTRAEVDALLAKDTGLAAERRRLERTVAALHALERPEPPADIVGRVRDRLAAERRAAERRAALAEPEPAAPVTPRRFKWGGIEAAIGLLGACAVAVLVMVAGGHRGTMGESGANGTHAAGITAEEGAVPTTLVVPGLPHAVVTDLAARAGMDTMRGDVYAGDRRAAGRFLLALKQAAAERGAEVSGFVPDAARVQITVRAK